MEPNSEKYDDFLGQFWADVDSGAPRQIDHYLARFPTSRQQILTEFEAFARWQNGSDSASAIDELWLAARMSSSATGAAHAALLRMGHDGAAAPDFPLPSRVGRFEVLRALHKGGMGVILLGHDPEQAREVVLKTARPQIASDAQVLQRLWREARIASHLAHESICPVEDVVIEQERAYLVMPFIDGETLAARLKRARGRDHESWIGVSEALELTDQDSVDHAADASRGQAASHHFHLQRLAWLMERIASAAHAMHEAGVVHRDLKPSNIMIRRNGLPVILDFGLAVDVAESVRLTETGQVLGTPIYMAPEQVQGRVRDVDRRTDVYSLGLILYELLTLHQPFDAPSREAVYHRILAAQPPLPRKLARHVPRSLEAICLKAMAFERKHRYATAAELGEDLRRARLMRPTMAKRASSFRLVGRRVRRYPLTASIVVLCVLLGVLSSWWWHRHRTAQAGRGYYEAFARVQRAFLDHDQPPSADLDRLAKLLPDEASRKAFLRDPSSQDVWRDLYRHLGDLPRGRAGMQLVSPRGVIGGPPEFALVMPGGRGLAADRDSDGLYRVELWEVDGTATESFEVNATRAPDGRATFALPDQVTLRTGCPYRWRAAPANGPGGDPMGLDLPPPAQFTLVAPEQVASLLTIETTGRATLDRLLRAAALNAHGLAEASLDQLDIAAFAAASEPEQGLRALLEAEAWALLGDGDRLAALATIGTEPGSMPGDQRDAVK